MRAGIHDERGCMAIPRPVRMLHCPRSRLAASGKESNPGLRTSIHPMKDSARIELARPPDAPAIARMSRDRREGYAAESPPAAHSSRWAALIAGRGPMPQ